MTAPWRSGLRGLAGGSSLVRLLNEQRGKRKRLERPPLSEAQILQWADAYQARTGAWPVREAGPVAEMPDETWKAVDRLLRQGGRGLAGGSSLALLLAERRGVRNAWTRAHLSVPQIQACADAHHDRTGQWPIADSGSIPEAPGETWRAVSLALFKGGRGLPPGSARRAHPQVHIGRPAPTRFSGQIPPAMGT